MQEQLLVLLGPTACGKTGVGVLLGQVLHAEIVSADSVAVFRGLTIGSARPTPEEQGGVPHHLLDCIECDDVSFTVAKYKELAVDAIDGILSRGRLPILVGGSGLYLDAVTSSMSYAVDRDLVLRESLSEEYRRCPQAFWERLYRIDPVTAGRLHVNDQKRLVRAMEVFQITGRTFSSWNAEYHEKQASSGPYTVRKIGLTMPKDELDRRISARVDDMMQRGLLEEARKIYERELDRQLPAMKSIGYAQLFAYFDGDLSLPDAVEMIKRDTRRFAKRQMTWFKRDSSIIWYHVGAYADAQALAYDIRKDIGEVSVC